MSPALWPGVEKRVVDVACHAAPCPRRPPLRPGGSAARLRVRATSRSSGCARRARTRRATPSRRHVGQLGHHACRDRRCPRAAVCRRRESGLRSWQGSACRSSAPSHAEHRAAAASPAPSATPPAASTGSGSTARATIGRAPSCPSGRRGRRLPSPGPRSRRHPFGRALRLVERRHHVHHGDPTSCTRANSSPSGSWARATRSKTMEAGQRASRRQRRRSPNSSRFNPNGLSVRARILPPAWRCRPVTAARIPARQPARVDTAATSAGFVPSPSRRARRDARSSSSHTGVASSSSSALMPPTLPITPEPASMNYTSCS